MVLDEETLERMLASNKGRSAPARPPTKVVDETDEFEVYERAAPPPEPEPVAAPVEEEPFEEYPPRAHRDAAPSPPPAQQPVQPPPQPPQPPVQPTAPQAAQGVPAQPMPEPVVPQPEPVIPHPEPAHQEPVATNPPQPAPPAQPISAPQPPRPQVFTPQRPSTAPSFNSQTQAADSPVEAPAKSSHGAAPRIAIVQADYNSDVTDVMASWAVKHAEKNGATVSHHLHVPGVYDLALTCKILAKRKDVDGVVAIGAVVQGETGHDELIAREAARLLGQIAYDFEVPVGLAVAGPRMTMAQAEARVTMGRNAVEAVLRQLAVLRSIGA